MTRIQANHTPSSPNGIPQTQHASSQSPTAPAPPTAPQDQLRHVGSVFTESSFVSSSGTAPPASAGKGAPGATPGKPSRTRRLAPADLNARKLAQADPAAPAGPTKSQGGSPWRLLAQVERAASTAIATTTAGLARLPLPAERPVSDADRARIGQTVDLLLWDQEMPGETGSRMAIGLADALKGMRPAEQTELIQQMVKRDPKATSMALSGANGMRGVIGFAVSPEDRAAIGRALGRAYESGAVSRLDLTLLIAAPWSDPGDLGAVIAQSGSRALMADASQRMLQSAEAAGRSNFENGADSYYRGAAKAASGNLEVAKGLLGTLGSGPRLERFVKGSSPGQWESNDYDLHNRGVPHGKGALGDFIGTIAEMKPPTALSNELFDRSAGKVGEDPSMKRGLASYFQNHLPGILERLAKTGGPDAVEKGRVMASFSENVLFGDPFNGQADPRRPAFDGQQRLREVYSKQIAGRIQELRDAPLDPPGNPPTTQQLRDHEIQMRAYQEKAQQLGFLIGGTEVGFKRALKHVEDRNAARDGMVDMIFGIVDKLPAAVGLELPGGEFVLGKGSDALKGKVKAWVHEKKPSVEELTLPLYRLGKLIPGDFHTPFEAIRGSADQNERQGYND